MGHKKYSHLGYILKVALTKFSDELDVLCERRSGVPGDSKVFYLSNWKDGVVIN